MLVDEGIDLLLGFLQMLPEHLLAFFFGDTGLAPQIQLILGNGGAVADTVVVDIPIGLALKAFPNLHHIDEAIAAGKGRCAGGLDGAGGKHDNEHCQGKSHSKNSSHGSVSSQMICMPAKSWGHNPSNGRIIADISVFGNPFGGRNYRIVTLFIRKMFPSFLFIPKAPHFSQNNAKITPVLRGARHPICNPFGGNWSVAFPAVV